MSISAESNTASLSAKLLPKRLWSLSKPFINQLISRKPMIQLQEEILTQNPLERTLNWVQLTGIGLGAIIGQ